MPDVYIVKCETYDPEIVEKAVWKAFESLDWKNLFKRNEKILLKPNLLSAKAPELAVTTHPSVFGAVAKALKKAGTSVSYGDCPATDSSARAQKICKISQIADEIGIDAADFVNSYNHEYPQGVVAKNFRFVNAVRDNDGIVSIAKFKTHALTRFTGAMKNQFGLIPGLLKAKDHVKYPSELVFSKMLVDLNKCVAPRLFVMDAVIGMEGNGPANGKPKEIGYIMLSTDPVALDSVCVAMAGLDWKDVLSVKTGNDFGLGIANLDKIRITYIEDFNNPKSEITKIASVILPDLIIKDFENALAQKSAIGIINSLGSPIARRLFLNRPYILENNCTKCKKCVVVCPVEPKAIKFDEKKKKIVYKYSKCIRCFCCQETCPFGAIAVKKGAMQFLFEKKK